MPIPRNSMQRETSKAPFFTEKANFTPPQMTCGGFFSKNEKKVADLAAEKINNSR